MKTKMQITGVALALAAGVTTTSAQTLVWSENFDAPLTGWTTLGLPGTIQQVNQQLVISEDFFGPLQTNNVLATHVPAAHSFTGSGALPDHQTLEMRADLVSANQNDACAGLAFNWVTSDGHGYLFCKDEDEVWLAKFYNTGSSGAWFFVVNQPIKNQNVTLVLALTRVGSDVMINTRVLDKDNANAVLFDRTVTDTPQSDPVLPDRAYKGMNGGADLAATPWPVLTAPTYIELIMQWVNPLSVPSPNAQVVYDNLEVWQYQSPQLAIQNAVVLSWPAAAAQFILERGPTVDGPWETVLDPWWRTNATQIEVSIPASDSIRLFRLRFAP